MLKCKIHKLTTVFLLFLGSSYKAENNGYAILLDKHWMNLYNKYCHDLRSRVHMVEILTNADGHSKNLDFNIFKK